MAWFAAGAADAGCLRFSSAIKFGDLLRAYSVWRRWATHLVTASRCGAVPGGHLSSRGGRRRRKRMAVWTRFVAVAWHRVVASRRAAPRNCRYLRYFRTATGSGVAYALLGRFDGGAR